jgi:hypothetical protein
MSESDDSHMSTESSEMRALDAALAAVLEPPALPSGFRTRLAALLAEAERAGDGRAARAAALDRELRERLAELDAGYLRLRRRTLGALIGGAFAAGAVMAVAMPWLEATFGANRPYALAGAGTLIALALIGAWMSSGRSGLGALRPFW